MNLEELIDAAKRKAGSIGAVGEQLKIVPGRLADWKAGRRKPESGDIGKLAEIAGLPVLETMVEIEEQLGSRHADLWRTLYIDWCPGGSQYKS